MAAALKRLFEHLVWQHRWKWYLWGTMALLAPVGLTLALPVHGVWIFKLASVAEQLIGSALGFYGIVQVRRLFPWLVEQSRPSLAVVNEELSKLIAWLRAPVGSKDTEIKGTSASAFATVSADLVVTVHPPSDNPTPEKVREELMKEISKLRASMHETVQAVRTSLDQVTQESGEQLAAVQNALAGGTNNQILALVLLGVGGVFSTVGQDIACWLCRAACQAGACSPASCSQD